MSYYYRKTVDPAGKQVYVVGYYRPITSAGGADWIDESKHATSYAAAKRVNYLNGGTGETPSGEV